MLGQALSAAGEDGYVLTHGFHPYPGRFHPRLASLLIERFGQPGQTVLDPFMGGGTALVEAMLLGRQAMGSDLNPIAVLIARERTRPRTRREVEDLTAEAERIAAVVEALRRERKAPRLAHPGLPRLAPHYAPHLFAEMVQWIRLVDALPAGPLRETMQAVFSAGVTKFSNRQSDSTDTPAPPRFPKGAVTRYFVRKTTELARAQLELRGKLPKLPKGTEQPRVLQEDARLLPSLGWGEIDQVVTSPPYPGVYDYHEHHRLRLEWMQLAAAEFESGEAGARRTEGEGWSAAMRDVFGTLARVMRPGGSLFVVIGDWMHDRHGVDAAAQLLRLAEAKGWRCESRASAQRRPHGPAERSAFGKRGKWEHLLHLNRDAI